MSGLVLEREGHPLEGVSPSMFPHLKRTHKYKENPLCQRTLLLMRECENT
jgi:hypothetical protein